jgi:hypothetical protein
LEIYTLILLLLVIYEYIIRRKRNESKVLLKEVYGRFDWIIILKIIASIIHPNLLFFRKKWIDEETYNGDDKILKFRRNFNEYLYLF